MTNIVIPAKNPSTAKQRLTGFLSADQRRQLAEAILDHVLSTAAQVRRRCHVLVVTDHKDVARRAKELDLDAIVEPLARGETAAVTEAAAWSCREGFERQIVIPGDIPCLLREDLETLLNLPLQRPSVVLCPATGDDGTNAIVTTPPDALTFRFGRRSFPDYIEQARKKNIPCQVLRLNSLVLDLDTPEDAKTFLDMNIDTPARRMLSAWLPVAKTLDTCEN